MIDALTLLNFKCFEHQEIQLGGLTLLAGLNGMGKSSVLQGLLLLRQSAIDGMLPGTRSARRDRGSSAERRDGLGAVPPDPGLLLNGTLVHIGTARDALYEYAQQDQLGFRLWQGANEFAWDFGIDDLREDVLKLARGPDELPPLSIFSSAFQYLAAERIGPRDLYETSDYHVHRRRDLGADGRYSVAFLDTFGSELVAEPLRHAGAKPQLSNQVNAWMGEVSPGIQLTVQRLLEVNRATMGVEFATAAGVPRQRPFRPSSVGFGISYTLPVLLAILGAAPGSLVLIENPEAHLHPQGQLAMGRLFACAAAADVQVVIETHSDHVLNGVRLAVKNGVIPPELVQIHYVTRESEDIRMVHRVVSPRIDSDGRFDEWPEGFFEQWDQALDELLAT